MLVVGGGPAGSSCATVLARAGLDVVVLDRARFPRVKLCAGWLTAPVWDVLEMSPHAYPRGLWQWNQCHVFFAGRQYTFRVRGYFIRRFEFDDFLLRQSGAEVVQGAAVKTVARRADGRWEAGGYRARYLVGAGGTHCPVRRSLFSPRRRDPVGVQEHEFPADPEAVARTRVGGDGEPVLLLHEDLRGYSWNIPKTEWLNVGCGTVAAREVRDAWQNARLFLSERKQLPPQSLPMLEQMKGHSYYLFDPVHLGDAHRDGAFVVGDALGLAHPLTAEGILPAVISGTTCARAIVDGDPSSYPQRLAQHPTLRDYAFLFRLREAGSALRARRRIGGGRRRTLRPGVVTRLVNTAIAAGFAHLFAGRPVPGGRILGRRRKEICHDQQTGG